MSALVTALCFVGYFFGYIFYSRFLARRLFELDPAAQTPSHELRDGVDYVPTNRFVLFGHHWASITGLSPMLGPAVAVIWGWLPAMLWVLVGALFVGCVHDFGSLVVSMRAKGMSIGKVTEGIIGKRAKTLFHLIIFFLIALAMGVFVHIIATLFSPAFYPEAVLPSGLLIVIALMVGIAACKGAPSPPDGGMPCELEQDPRVAPVLHPAGSVTFRHGRCRWRPGGWPFRSRLGPLRRPCCPLWYPPGRSPVPGCRP